MSLLDLTQEASSPLTDEEKALLPALVQNASYALLAGVRLTWHDWVCFSSLERAAFVVAARRLEVERATRGAVAASGPLGLASIAAEVDGGESLVLLAAKAVARG